MELARSEYQGVWGTALDIVIHEPTGFQFENARVNALLTRHELTSGSRLVLIGVSLLLASVQLLLCFESRVLNSEVPTSFRVVLLVQSLKGGRWCRGKQHS